MYPFFLKKLNRFLFYFSVTPFCANVLNLDTISTLPATGLIPVQSSRPPQIHTNPPSLSVGSLAVIHSLNRNFLPNIVGSEVIFSHNIGAPIGRNIARVRDYAPIKIGDHLVAYISFLNRYTHFLGGQENLRSSRINTDPNHPGVKIVSYKLNNDVIQVPTRTLNLILEGGNVLYLEGSTSTPPTLILSDKVIAVNGRTLAEQIETLNVYKYDMEDGDMNIWKINLSDSGYRPRSRDEIMNELHLATGVSQDRIFFMPRMPGETTGLIDIYSGILDPETLAIMDFPDALIQNLPSHELIQFAQDIKQWLNEQAQFIISKGIKVKRIPSLPPQILYQIPKNQNPDTSLFPSTASFFLFNGVAYIPSFPYINDLQQPSLIQALDREVDVLFSSFGYRTMRIEVPWEEYLAGFHLHSLTAEVPLPKTDTTVGQ